MELDLKLTRSEAIALILDDLEEQLEKRHDEAQASLTKAKKDHAEAVDRMTLSDFKGRFGEEVSVSRENYGKDKGKYYVSVQFHVERKDLPKRIRELEDLVETEQERFNDALAEYRKFSSNTSKMRNRLLRTAIEQSKEGQDFLKRLEVLKSGLARQVLSLPDKKGK